jgi:arylsulfatase A
MYRFNEILSFSVITCAFACSGFAGKPPNVVFIFADDLGYGDLGCYGHPVAKTPRIDRLAKEGVRFTQHYANGPECSPTRTALLTGRYQQRAGGLECAIGTGNVGRYDEAIRLAEKHQLGLPANQSVLPSSLKEAGYTCGVFGKWHLGYEPQFNPINHGWDEFFGYMGGNVHYFNHRELSDLHVLFKDRLPVYRKGYMTHLITDSSIDFIKRNKGKPFFLYVSHECPHFPFQGPGDEGKVVDETNWTQTDAKAYVAMLEDLDSEVGRLLKALEENNLAKDTLVIFVSDNGGFAKAANMGPLRGAKSSTLEGGIRVPLIIRWPGRIDSGKTNDQVCATFDLTCSILNLAGAKTPANLLDGFDVIDHVAKQKPNFNRTLYWRGKRGGRTWWAVRDGNLKYLRKTEGHTEEWLYDLSHDIGESNDLSQRNPEQVTRLKKLLADWEKQVQPVR